MALRIAPTDESAYGHLLYLVELPDPPLLRVSGVAGLVLDDYCSIGSSLKTLTKVTQAIILTLTLTPTLTLTLTLTLSLTLSLTLTRESRAAAEAEAAAQRAARAKARDVGEI